MMALEKVYTHRCIERHRRFDTELRMRQPLRNAQGQIPARGEAAHAHRSRIRAPKTLGVLDQPLPDILDVFACGWKGVARCISVGSRYNDRSGFVGDFLTE